MPDGSYIRSRYSTSRFGSSVEPLILRFVVAVRWFVTRFHTPVRLNQWFGSDRNSPLSVLSTFR